LVTAFLRKFSETIKDMVGDLVNTVL